MRPVSMTPPVSPGLACGEMIEIKGNGAREDEMEAGPRMTFVLEPVTGYCCGLDPLEGSVSHSEPTSDVARGCFDSEPSHPIGPLID